MTTPQVRVGDEITVTGTVRTIEALFPPGHRRYTLDVATAPAEPDADEREALAKRLYDEEGFHAADHWGVESSITRGRYEALADAVLRLGYSRTPDAHLAAAKELDAVADQIAAGTREFMAAFSKAGEGQSRRMSGETAALLVEDRSLTEGAIRARAVRLREQGDNR